MKNLSQFSLLQSAILISSFFILWFYIPVGSNLDLTLISPWVDSAGQFPFKDSWFLATLNHRYVKNIIILIYCFYFFTWIASFKFKKLKPLRHDYAYFFFASMLCTILIGFIKAHSAHACPWDMTVPTNTGFTWNFSAIDGHCFPGGHASTGFALMTGYFVYFKSNTKRAYFFLITGLILGFTMGWAQMMRGAHFLSHNLWTAWITWLINFIVYMLIHYYQMVKQKNCALESAE